MRQPLLHKLDQLSTDRWARRGVRMLLRAAWLSVCIWCIALGGHMLWGWPLQTNLVGALALTVVGGAVVLLLRPRQPPPAAWIGASTWMSSWRRRSRWRPPTRRPARSRRGC